MFSQSSNEGSSFRRQASLLAHPDVGSGDCSKKLHEQTNYVMVTGETKPGTEPSLELVRASIPCPNAECYLTSKEGKTWICLYCDKELEYDFVGNFYCGCGMSDVNNYEFHCSNGRHGEYFTRYDSGRLQAELNILEPYEKINILVIGQTGIGKSTWINATATYITHETLEAAAEDEFSYLIPFQFTTTTITENGHDVIEIIIGESKNEVYEDKKSVTQFPKAHYFKSNDQQRVYCIVDTPGVGDCQGIENDKKNMQNIVNYIGRLGQINLICFLLPPNEARLDPVFEFCFKELIMQFHRSAVQNIAFCFTKASGCGFKVSETIVPLRQLVNEIKKKQGIDIMLNQSSLFVFDNIAYRYLAQLHKTGTPEEDQALLDLNARSYEVSAKETKKMLEKALKTPPHLVEDTLYLNSSRRIISKLAPILARIATKVDQTIHELNAIEKEVQNARGRETEMLKILKRRVTIYRFRMSFKTLFYCNECAEYTEYTGAEREKMVEADPTLADEDPVIMVTGGLCKQVEDKWICEKCGPDFVPQRISKIFYKVYENREEIDEEVQIKLNEAQSDADKCKILIKEKKRLKRELESVMKQIQRASAKFAIFLQENSITAYNDIAEKYLLQLMDLEEKKGLYGGERHKALSRMLDEHKKEIEIIEQRINDADQSSFDGFITAHEVMKTAEELRKLKHYGSDIYEALEGVKQLETSGDDEEPLSIYNQPRSPPPAPPSPPPRKAGNPIRYMMESLKRWVFGY